jgi:hypothetical protein
MRRFFGLGLRYLPLADALRGGLICAVPAVAAAKLHMPLLCWSAIAAFWTCLADESNRPAAARLVSGLSFGVLGAVASACAIATHALPVLSIAIVGAVSYACAWSRTRGAASGLRGILTATACAVAACFPVQGVSSGAQYGLFYFGGCLWAAIAGVGLWQTDDGARSRMATLAFLHTMATFVDRLARAARGDHAQLERGRAMLRTRLDAMIAVSASSRGDLPPICRKWFGDAERAMALLAGVESRLAAADAGERREAAAVLAPVLSQLAGLVEARAKLADRASSEAAEALEHDRAALLDALEVGIAQFEKAHDGEQGLTWLRACETLIGRFCELLLRTASERALPSGVKRDAAAEVKRQPGARLSALRAAIVSRNVCGRYASRLGVAAMVAVALARISGVQQGYWLALTTMFILQPTLSQTVKLSGLRIGGTLLGAVLASALSLLVHNPLLLALAIVPLATGTLAARSVSYVSYILFLTSHFILVAHLGTPIGPSWMLAALRLGNSVAGVLVGVAVSLCAWPDRERHRIGEAAYNAMSATAAYLRAIGAMGADGADAVQGRRGGGESLTTLRRRACLAIDTLEATIAATRFESLAVDSRAATASVAMQQMKALVGALAPLEYLDDTLGETDRAAVAKAAGQAAGLVAGEWPSTEREACFPGGRDGVLLSCHAREIGREIAESAWILHALRARVVP